MIWAGFMFSPLVMIMVYHNYMVPHLKYVHIFRNLLSSLLSIVDLEMLYDFIVNV